MKIEVKDYVKTIKGKMILDHINVTFESGKVYGLYGRNGSGKTMLLRAMCSLIFPDHGDVLIDGVSIIHDDFDLRSFGVLLEDPGYYPFLSGIDNLDLLYTINHKSDQAYLESLMEEMDLKEAKDKKFKEYSLGMKQKLRIIQTYMENQTIIFLDEPTNGLDEKSVETVRNKILKLKSEGKLIVLASHNKDDLKLLCDTIYKLESGALTGEITL